VNLEVKSYLKAAQKSTTNREHLPAVHKSHPDAYSAPTDDDESEEVRSSELANKEIGRNIEQEVTVK